MEKISAEFVVTVDDFRRANYCSIVIRYRSALLMAAGFFAAALIYTILSLFGIVHIYPFLIYLGAACLFFLLLIIARVEIGIRSYRKKPGSLIGKKYIVTLSETTVGIKIPELGVHASFAVKDLACVIEIDTEFLLYADRQQTYLLPHRAYSEPQRAALRNNFRKKLAGRFSVRC